MQYITYTHLYNIPYIIADMYIYIWNYTDKYWHIADILLKYLVYIL